jgi:hypothetical protein
MRQFTFRLHDLDGGAAIHDRAHPSHDRLDSFGVSGTRVETKNVPVASFIARFT